jgi:hypothetical protein
VHLRTLTLGPWTFNSQTPRGMLPGATLADTAVSPSTPGGSGTAAVRWEFRKLDQTVIFETDGITIGNIKALCKPALSGGSAAVVFTASPGLPETDVPAHIVSAAEGQWTDIAQNTMSSVAFDYTGWGMSGFATGLSAILTAWSGGTYDSGRHRLLVHGGGHNDYDGNEFYAFDVRTANWSRLDNPSPYDEAAFGGGWNGVYPDNGPQPIHTYGMICVNPDTSKVYRLGISGSGYLSQIQEFDSAAASQLTPGDAKAYWSYKATVNWQDPSSGASAWMSDEGQFLIASRDIGTFISFRRYNPTTDTIGSTISAVTGAFTSNDLKVAYSPARRLAVCFRGTDSLVLVDTAANVMSLQTVSGATLPGGAGSIAYDLVRDLFWVWSDDSADRRTIYSIDPTTWVATEISPSGSTPSSPHAGDKGPYGRFCYAPEYDVLLAVNNVSGGVWIYKPVGWSPP